MKIKPRVIELGIKKHKKKHSMRKLELDFIWNHFFI